MTVPQGAHDHWQGQLPEANPHIRLRLADSMNYVKLCDPKSASNRDQPGYSNLNRDKK
jgi:hypothetical protein